MKALDDLHRTAAALERIADALDLLLGTPTPEVKPTGRTTLRIQSFNPKLAKAKQDLEAVLMREGLTRDEARHRIRATWGKTA